MEDRPNPGAKIGFVIFYPFQYYVYKSVYEQLAAEAEFIIDLGPFYPILQTPDVLPAIVTLLTKHGARFRILSEDTYVSPRAMDRFLAQYDTLVSVWMRGCMRAQGNAEKIRVHMTYGAGKELTMFDLAKSEYDLILAYGQRDDAFYAQISHSVIVGNPKFDEWFRGQLDMQSVSWVKGRLDPQKKTLLYLPTHSDLSSVDQLAQPLKELSALYNVIVKLHYYMVREEPQRVQALTDERVILCHDDVDLLPLLSMADIVLSDNSSAIFDAMLADKPILVADFHDAEFLDTTHRQLRTHRRGKAGALTYSGSFEQVIKRDGLVASLKDPEDLAHEVADALSDDARREKQRELMQTVFSYRDGKSGSRAADAIQDVRLNGTRHTRPFLWHAVQQFASSIRRQRPRGDTVSHAQSGTDDGTALIFLLDGADEDETSLKRSLRALIEQDSERKTDIVIVTPQKERAEAIIATLSHEIRSMPRIAIRIRETGDETLGSIVGSELRASAHAYVYFTRSDVYVRTDWQERLLGLMHAYVGVSGAGGFVRLPRKMSSDTDTYLIHERRRQLSLTGERSENLEGFTLVSRTMRNNPAGDLHTMLYRHSALVDVPAWITTVMQLEIFCRISALNTGALCFTMMPALLHRPRTLESLILESFERSREERLAHPFTHMRWVSAEATLASVIRSSLWYLIHHPRLAPIAFRVAIARWRGARSVSASPPSHKN